jgi:hypothetical protein
MCLEAQRKHLSVGHIHAIKTSTQMNQKYGLHPASAHKHAEERAVELKLHEAGLELRVVHEQRTHVKQTFIDKLELV